MSIQGGYIIKWKGVQLGDHAYLSTTYTDNTDSRIIPRAKGVKIWSTEELGGGFYTIIVNAVLARDNRYSLESYFNALDTNLSLTAKGDLTVIDRYSNTYTLTDCFLQSFSQEDSDLKVNRFTLRFIKSL